MAPGAASGACAVRPSPLSYSVRGTASRGNYALHTWGEPRGSQNAYGQWKVYIPGPRQPVPWFDHRRMLTDSVDALPGGGVYPIDDDLQLKTPLGGA